MVRPSWLLLAVACRADPPAIQGSWILSGDDVQGTLTGVPGSGCSDGQVKVGLWGPRWGTAGEVPADSLREDDGSVWLYFAVETGLGVAETPLHVQGQLARLPLGGRTGEFELQLTLSEGVLEEDERRALQLASQEALRADQEAWEEGSFRLMDGDQVVGDIQFAGAEATLLSVYDSWWLTPEPVEAERLADDADIVLAFPAEPSLLGETSSLRINIPTRQVVVPTGAVPVSGERQLRLEPGRVSASERDLAIEKAIEENTELEHRGVLELLRALAATAHQDSGDCLGPSALSAEMQAMLTGYSLDIAVVEDHCEISIEPLVEQHGRRFRGTVSPKGLVQED